jgi:hypothetical protein
MLQKSRLSSIRAVLKGQASGLLSTLLSRFRRPSALTSGGSEWALLIGPAAGSIARRSGLVSARRDQLPAQAVLVIPHWRQAFPQRDRYAPSQAGLFWRPGSKRDCQSQGGVMSIRTLPAERKIRPVVRTEYRTSVPGACPARFPRVAPRPRGRRCPLGSNACSSSYLRQIESGFK